MIKFDPVKYQMKCIKDVDWETTQRNFEVFIQAYKISRERIGQARLPKVTQSFDLAPMSTVNPHSVQSETILIQQEEDLEEFRELHDLFVKGFAAIYHSKPEKIARRRKVFYLRYIEGLNIREISEHIFFCRDVVIKESREAMLQFCTELELVVYKSEMRKG